MSRRKNRQQQSNSSPVIRNNHETDASTGTTSTSTNILIDKSDVTYSLLAGAFCIALLFALSEVIHRTDWLTPLINSFNSLI